MSGEDKPNMKQGEDIKRIYEEQQEHDVKKRKEEQLQALHPQFKVYQESKVLLEYIQNFSWNKNQEFDKFVHQSLLTLISRFMKSSNRMAEDLNMKKIDFTARGGTFFLIHPKNTEKTLFIWNFHELVKKMYKNGSLEEINEKFLEFYTWVEDVRSELLECRLEDDQLQTPYTHQLANQLYELINSDEQKEESTKKKKIEDDPDLFSLAQKTFSSIIELVVQMVTCDVFRQFEGQLSVVVEDEEDLNELMIKRDQVNPSVVSKYKRLREFIFQCTFAADQILNYIRIYIERENLNIIDTKVIDDFLKPESFQDGFFESFRQILNTFMKEIKKKNQERSSKN